jgi:hypothetical protein
MQYIIATLQKVKKIEKLDLEASEPVFLCFTLNTNSTNMKGGEEL